MRKISTLLLFFLCLAGCLPSGWGTPDWGEARTTHNLASKGASRLEFLWVQTVFTTQFSSRQLAATNGKVFLVGSLSQNGPRALVALESENGRESWSVPEAFTVDVAPDMVYVDYRNSVVAYSLKGEEIWRTKPPWARNIGYFSAVDGILYVSAGSGLHLLDAMTGELMDSITEYDPALAMYYWNRPAFVNRYVFKLNHGSVFGAVLAIDRKSGEILWQSADNVISNAAANENLVFLITHEDELQILAASTGKLLEKIPIEPSINFFDEEINPQYEGYSLAVDQTNQILYVLLGDSNQLFAFRIKSGK